MMFSLINITGKMFQYIYNLLNIQGEMLICKCCISSVYDHPAVHGKLIANNKGNRYEKGSYYSI
jgi:hypothetical protein